MSKKSHLAKKIIRQSILKKRKTLSESEKLRMELKVLKILKNFDVFKKASSIHIFISKFDEPKTNRIIEFCWESSKKVSVPYLIPGEKELFHSELKSFNDLIIGSFGVLEPKLKKIIDSKSEYFDLVIIPGVAFDLRGSRIGYGKGYYDRFLAQSSAFLLALAYDFQILKHIPTELHDIPMNGIISESRLILI